MSAATTTNQKKQKQSRHHFVRDSGTNSNQMYEVSDLGATEYSDVLGDELCTAIKSTTYVQRIYNKLEKHCV